MLPHMFQFSSHKGQVKASLVTDRINKIPSLKLLGEHFISTMSRHTRSGAYVAVLEPQQTGARILQPALVHYYFVHKLNILVNGTHYFAFVQYLSKRLHDPWPSFDMLEVPMYRKCLDPPDWKSIVPIHRLYAPIALAPVDIDNHIAAVFLPRKVKLGP